MDGSNVNSELQGLSIEDRLSSPDWVAPDDPDDDEISITEEEIEFFIKSILDKWPSSIYFTRLINDKNQTAFTCKINN